ncbi:PhnE/PtxC family ABC transporter permease [Prochlorococcus sp. MIT 1341]|uniref:PhnE/PtxC family ABC transporter permease n=1 Tax=Prochlorococcus sp. MIT 1341 TaxID=3096221 RepID=UPI002A74D19F|nr:ABC transporter permease subunit [Prochlorococcus sp. MIT 1341]
MRRVNFTAPIIALLPVIALIPISIKILPSIHAGGIPSIIDFTSAALNPSINPSVIESSFKGLGVTFSTAFISWLTSVLVGTLLGIFSSSLTWEILNSPYWVVMIIKRLLSIPRSIHELLWGLLLIQFIGINKWVAIIAIIIPFSSLFARVISDQIDTLDRNPIYALRYSGASPISIMITFLYPKILPLIINYSGYRFECALRGATLLGIFGLGGIGTELELTLRSLEFREMWTSIWILVMLIFLVEKALTVTRKKLRVYPQIKIKFGLILFISTPILLFISVFIYNNVVDLPGTIGWHPITLPTISGLKEALYQLPIFELIYKTLTLTILAASISISLPPLIMMIWPGSIGKNVYGLIWILLRTIPTPLIALLLQLITFPSLELGALALGAHNVGIMGRLLKDGIDDQNDLTEKGLFSIGVSQRVKWLYGNFSPQSPKYLAYSAYRTEVLLRETAVVGLIGGTGLGWQIIESLSSFNWNQLTILIFLYVLLTMSGETLSNLLSKIWMEKGKPAESY